MLETTLRNLYDDNLNHILSLLQGYALWNPTTEEHQ